MNEPKSTTITIDSIEQQQEKIEDVLEGLLIFPNQGGLHSAYKKTESLFENEQILMKGFEKETYDLVRESQKKIMKIFRKEMNNPPKKVKDDCGCWAGPKEIEKGCDKNTANRLAAAFERHTEQFKELYSEL